ncbi:hypothetical protein B0H17DRAFT_1192386 [Mycena rosella]|uniref:Uncharacterized protein n=1 Tax=Mycena rosella TaxID=1033263 RepID=A0AAD7GWV3_MYCRO|nr:hypothetical protein B0H17DRAFT_1192386 [Mycena rosella]
MCAPPTRACVLAAPFPLPAGRCRPTASPTAPGDPNHTRLAMNRALIIVIEYACRESLLEHGIFSRDSGRDHLCYGYAGITQAVSSPDPPQNSNDVIYAARPTPTLPAGAPII